MEVGLERDCPAVYGRDICFNIGGPNVKSILDGVDINVDRGNIYGLLGPSGCGKTTLLQCIVGQHRPSSGTMKIYGRVPGEKYFNIPGPGVGFMPQDLALYPDISAEETLHYFGRIYQMSSEDIENKINFLVDFLDIPDKKKLIKHLSGGQQRRVSFAVALIHNPPLLILDEPTVGVDPLLRKKIWSHLHTLATENKMTIIITTHYIEEAKQAHVVGLMRNGRLLIEMDPSLLIAQFGVTTLEEAFLKLCKNDKETTIDTPSDIFSNKNSEIVSFNGYYKKIMDAPIINQNKSEMKTKNDINLSLNNFKNGVFPVREFFLHKEKRSFGAELKATSVRLSALIGKNLTRYKRNIFLLLGQIFLPVLTMTICCLALGGDPYDLPLAVVNMETGSLGYGEKYLKFVDSHIIIQKPYSTLDEAINSVKKGQAWGALYISPNFTESLTERFVNGLLVENQTVQDSTIKLYMDHTNKQISSSIYGQLSKSFLEFSKAMLQSLDMNPNLATPSIYLSDPVYSSYDTPFTEYMAPAMICSLIYLSSVGITSIAIIVEKKEGLLDRSIIAGVRSWEFVFSLFFVLLLIGLVQSGIVVVAVLVVVNVNCLGSYLWVAASVVLVVLEGMSFGLLIASLTSDENIAILIVLGSYFPIINLSGVVWSLEALPYYFKKISYSLPLTLICNTLRSVMMRGWDITQIWDGYLSAVLWILPLILLSSMITTLKK